MQQRRLTTIANEKHEFSLETRGFAGLLLNAMREQSDRKRSRLVANKRSQHVKASVLRLWRGKTEPRFARQRVMKECLLRMAP